MSLLIKGGGKLVNDEDNAIEIPKDETCIFRVDALESCTCNRSYGEQLEQFRRHFVSLFEGKQARPKHLRDLILQCETERDNLEAPAWMRHIDAAVSERIQILSQLS